jgi:SIR2-like domain
MIDPLDSLTLSMHTSRGAFALLLGSGLSRAARIPTGWEIVEDLVRKLAAMHEEECGAEPAAWYEQNYGEAVGYSRLLEELTRSPTDRQQLIRAYVEPSADERAQGLKAPTGAHRAIARMAAAGHVRVILTTNFDRLMEKALSEAGVEPAVVSSPDQAKGLPPLRQVSCIVVKLHGDYQDPRFKNTTHELGYYEAPMRRLLERLLEDFGLVVCGWSAAWDGALRGVLERSRGQRFSLYWCYRGSLEAEAAALVALKRAQTVAIKDADSFFERLADRIEALDRFDRPHPLSVRMEVETLKGYLVKPLERIRLEELIATATETAYFEVFSEKRFPLLGQPFEGRYVVERLERYGSLLERIQALLVAGAAWGETRQVALWQKTLGRLAQPPAPTGPHNVGWKRVRGYPALRLLYAAGVAAIARGEFATLRGLMETTVRDEDDGRRVPLILAINSTEVIDGNTLRAGFGTKQIAPLCDKLASDLREPLRDLLPAEDEYQRVIDLFEYLLALCFLEKDNSKRWFPPGRLHYRQSENARVGALQEVERLGVNWPVLQAGFFGGDVTAFRALDSHFMQILPELHKAALFGQL